MLALLPMQARQRGRPAVMSSTLAPAPTHGELPWGSWSNGDEMVQLSIFLDEGVRPGSAVCEAAEGWLCVFIDNSYEAFYDDQTGAWGGEEVVRDEEGEPPLLLGRFAQLVRARDLEYIVRERDGRRELLIELPKALDDGDGSAPTVPSTGCIFDETLTVRGEPCLVPGLSQPVE